jgi:competence protein ComEA
LLVVWKNFVKDYLSFNRKERIAVVVIAALMLLVILAPKIASIVSKKGPANADTAWFSTVRKLEQKISDSVDRNYRKDYDDKNDYAYQYDRTKSNYNENSNLKRELFYFDPNTLNAAGWKKLGLREKTVQTIQNYLGKGGKFRKPDDLKRVYGLRENEYERLEPYIKIEGAAETKKYEPFVKTNNETQPAKPFTSRYSVIDVNISDTTAFISLQGIGNKLAARIVNFRDKLGGFYSVEQVKETFGLPDSTYQKIKQYLKLDNTSVKKININTATIDELKAHPYIKYSLANPIVAYRNEHGLFSKVEDVKKVMVVTEDVYNKIAPYLFVQ